MKTTLNLIAVSVMFAVAVSCSKGDSGGSGSDTLGTSPDGKGGSMARFAVYNDMLYTVSTNTLKLFNISEPANPKYSPQRDLNVGFDIETVFPMDDMLFIGSRSGMYVYDVSEPRFPQPLAQVNHIRSCDPVVAQGDYAYVTLNTNVTSCGSSTNNVLDIYDISNPLCPELKRTVQLNGPTGLGVDGTKLFVCDNGLKVFDISEPLNIKQVDDIADIEEVDVRSAYDVIPVNGLLILTAAEGLYQFDYSGERLTFVSKIEINR